MFEIENQNDDSVTLLLKSDDGSKTQYPFDYELRVTYELSYGKLDVRYEVKNLSKETMYFSIGAHEGYRLPCDLEKYEIEFPQKETLYTYNVEGNVLTGEKELILKDNKVLPLKPEYFANDALIFKDLRSRSVILKTEKRKRRIIVTFDGFDYFLIWTVPQAGFVCLEPWCGITDSANHDKDITKKEGIIALPSDEILIRSHSIEIV